MFGRTSAARARERSRLLDTLIGANTITLAYLLAQRWWDTRHP